MVCGLDTSGSSLIDSARSPGPFHHSIIQRGSLCFFGAKSANTHWTDSILMLRKLERYDWPPTRKFGVVCDFVE